MVGDKCLFRSRPYYWRKCKTERGETHIDSLPDELLLEILARLSDDPHFLYNKARLVCRRWCHLIQSPDFIKTQLHRSTYGLLFSLLDHGTIVMTATQGRIETCEIPDDGGYFRSRCSCNGLILLQRHGNDPMHIVNPTTRQQLILPSFCYERYAKVYNKGCGIGYAADSMVYKVVVPYLNMQGRTRLGILSVGIDKSWRCVEVKHLSSEARSLLRDSFVCNTDQGFIIWSIKGPGRSYLTLDVDTEILTLHPSPVSEDYLDGRRMIYLSTGRSLSMLVVDTSVVTKFVMEFWEMKEESGEWRKVRGDIKLGAHEHWLKHIYGARGSFLTPLGWVRFPEVLALYIIPYDWRGLNACIFFNINTQEIWSMELPKECVSYRGQPHKKSLAWIT